MQKVLAARKFSQQSDSVRQEKRRQFEEMEVYNLQMYAEKHRKIQIAQRKMSQVKEYRIQQSSQRKKDRFDNVTKNKVIDNNLRKQKADALNRKFNRIKSGGVKEEIKPFVTQNQLERSMRQRETYRLKQLDVLDNLAQIKARRERLKSAIIYKHINLKNN